MDPKYADHRKRRKQPSSSTKGLSTALYLDLKHKLIEAGYEEEIRWAENVGECKSAIEFSREHAFVVCNSGMKEQIARSIYEKLWKILLRGKRKLNEKDFGHNPKRMAIQWVFDNQETLFRTYTRAKSIEEKLEFLQTLPHIGPITVYHLAKNFGVDCCKPDRHLERIAQAEGTTPAALCAKLAKATGDRIATVDMVLWRAANLGLI